MTRGAQDSTRLGAAEPAAVPDMAETAEGRGATVLQVVPAMVTGGVERGTVEVAGAIVEAGGRALVASAGGPMVHELTRAGAEHIELPLDSKNPLVMWKNAQRLAGLIRAEGVDIIHARSRAPAWSAWFASRAARCHFVTTFHGTYGHANALKRRYNAVMTRGERVIAISAFIAGHMRRLYGVPAGRIRIVHRGVDLQRFDTAKVSAERVIQLARAWRLPDGAPVVMLPGRLTRWKGQPVFIEAVAALRHTEAICLMVGSDQGRHAYHDELEQMIVSRGLSDRVRIIEQCTDMPAAYMLTDVVVSASTDPEAFGRVIAEAQALGRPVVASDHGGAQETVVPGETGFLVPPGDAAALAGAIDAVLDMDATRRKALSERAILHIRENFSKDVMCAKTLEIYNEVLARELAG